jgi:SlyX protein
MDDARVVDLEVKLGYQEQMLDDLNEVVTRQQGQIDRLEKMVEQLTDSISDVQEASSGPRRPEDERPPHY